jgi:3-oxoacyl-[acyl-carrier protein] reductase
MWPSGIRVNAVQPGVIDTDDKRGPRGETWLRTQAERTPLGVNGTPADIGAACVYLASDEARWVTGSILVVDGGCRIPMGNEDYMRTQPRTTKPS